MKTTEIKETLGSNGYEIKLTASAASGQRGDELWIYEDEHCDQHKLHSNEMVAKINAYKKRSFRLRIE